MHLRALLLALLPLTLVAQEAPTATPAALPPQEEAPFKIVVEDVPIEEPAQPVLTPEEEAEAPVAEEPEEVPQQDPEPNCGHSTLPPSAFDRETLMLQIFLDRCNFSCGVIDGVWGETSRLAMRAWQKSEGVRQTQWVDVDLYAKIAVMDSPIIPYAITAEDVALVTGVAPSTWAERAQMKLMGYETLGACVAERFHTSERTLRRLNPAVINWPADLREGTILYVPNVRMAALERPTKIVIALDDCVLMGFDDQGVERLRFPCSIARNKSHLPKAGEVTIKNMAPAPNYTYDPANYGQDPAIGKMVVPAGPRNPVGSRWIGLSLPGYGIHGTPRPNTVGRPESRGCFRLTNWNIEKLFELVRPGMRVEIIQSLKDLPTVLKPVEEKPAPQPQPVAQEPAPAEEPPAQEATPAP